MRCQHRLTLLSSLLCLLAGILDHHIPLVARPAVLQSDAAGFDQHRITRCLASPCPACRAGSLYRLHLPPHRVPSSRSSQRRHIRHYAQPSPLCRTRDRAGVCRRVTVDCTALARVATLAASQQIYPYIRHQCKLCSTPKHSRVRPLVKPTTKNSPGQKPNNRPAGHRAGHEGKSRFGQDLPVLEHDGIRGIYAYSNGSYKGVAVGTNLQS